MYFRSIIFIVAAFSTVYASFDHHSPKFSGAPEFKPYYLKNPHDSKYEYYGNSHGGDDKYNKYEHKDSHYEPTYYANYNQDPSYYNSYEPKHSSHGKDYYSSYSPSYTPYYGSYYNEPKHNDYHSKYY